MALYVFNTLIALLLAAISFFFNLKSAFRISLLSAIVPPAALFGAFVLLPFEKSVAVFIGNVTKVIGWYPNGPDVWFPFGVVVWYLTIFFLFYFSLKLGAAVAGWVSDRRS